ncbi:MAG: hypothetical protein VKI83_10285 [Synechococcaceae cyanobacterium]|nr:hypothetical protein [Synechococcaceae cyanobacterium]
MIECRSGPAGPAVTITAGRIITPAGSTIEPDAAGGYRICDADHHCRRATSLWEAQQLVQWAEVHHRPLTDREPPD